MATEVFNLHPGNGKCAAIDRIVNIRLLAASNPGNSGAQINWEFLTDWAIFKNGVSHPDSTVNALPAGTTGN